MCNITVNGKNFIVVVDRSHATYIYNIQGGRGHWDVYYTSPHKIYKLAEQLLGLLIEFWFGWFIKLSVQTF